MNYLSFFELNQEPFSNAPVSRFYYGSQQHGRALIRLMHAIESMKGLAVLIGEIGAGKTTTARRLLESLPEEQYEAALLVMVQSGVSPQWLITKIAYQLGVTQPSEDKTRLLGQLYRRLYAIHESGRKAVVLVDEAQMLNTREVMEEVRGLLNMEIPDQKLLTVVFFGLPELEESLKLDPPLYQRIAVRCRLDPLSPESTEAYIKHRLKLAGASRMLFTQEAVQTVHRASSGIPRLINTLCDNALFEGFLSRVNPITARIVEGVVAELGYDGVTERGGYINAAPPFPVEPSQRSRPAAPPPERRPTAPRETPSEISVETLSRTGEYSRVSDKVPRGGRGTAAGGAANAGSGVVTTPGLVVDSGLLSVGSGAAGASASGAGNSTGMGAANGAGNGTANGAARENSVSGGAGSGSAGAGAGSSNGAGKGAKNAPTVERTEDINSILAVLEEK